MSNHISEDCGSGLHDYCTPCECQCHGSIKYLHCQSCGKTVSTGFVPLITDTPDKGIIVRAYIECPECIATRS